MFDHTNGTEGSNPFLTARRSFPDSNKNPTSQRFWSKVCVGETNDCWLWKASIDREGYGRFSFEGTRKFAHRIAFILSNGEIPESLRICHTCDNPSCVNPAHLFAGTHQDNMDDRGAKGRTASGERNGRAKLTWEIVRQIRAAYVPRENGITKLSESFGVNKYVVQDIVRGRTWKEAA